MSDQTPSSTEDLKGAEPSMEDILASIRKIISEDEPVALESPEDAAIVNIAEAEPAALQTTSMVDNVLSEFGRAPEPSVDDTAANGSSESFEAETFVDDSGSVDLDIDSVLASLDDDLLSDAELEQVEAPVSEMPVSKLHVEPAISPEANIEDAVDLGADDDDILAFLDQGLDLDGDATDELVSNLSDDMDVDLNGVEDFVLPSSEIAPEIVNVPESENLLNADAAITEPAAELSSSDAEMDELLDEILMTPEDDFEDFASGVVDSQVTDSATSESQISDDGVLDIANDMQESEEDSDLELVKSLMADLADDPDSTAEIDADLDALLEIPELDDAAEVVIDEEFVVPADIQAADAPASDSLEQFAAEDTAVEGVTLEDAAAEEESDILGDILDMTLDDELESQPDEIDLDALMDMDDVAEAEQENILENAFETETAPVEPEFEAAADAGDDLPNLSDIAAAAEADAVAVETGAMTQQIMAAATTAAAGAGLAALGAKVVEAEDKTEAETSETLDVETDAADIDSKIDSFIDKLSADPSADEEITETQSHQETSMPVKAVVTDTILDEVTETATAGAFAELNQVVEDKAIFNERGPRIGDLVQEALRPMLKEWLDANLKGIVERAVTKEVKRISKGQ